MSGGAARPLSPAELDLMCINTVRFLAVDAVQNAGSGHPGLPLEAAPLAHVLWTQFLKHDPAEPGWFDRDRFVLSAGHGSMLLYALLYLTGYKVSLDQIRRFRQWDSLTPGHPERGLTPGVEITTGPLGQGFANGVGMAAAQAHLAARFNRPGFDIVDHFIYGIVSDGDLMEGVASEAASLAGHLRLGKLIYLYCDNRITLSGTTDLTFTEDRALRFESYGWHTQILADGNDTQAVRSALDRARSEVHRPSLILARTHLGYGSPHKQDTFEAHGSPLGPEEVRLTKQRLGWPVEPEFLVPGPVLEYYREALTRGHAARSRWTELISSYARAFPGPASELARRIQGSLAEGWETQLPVFPADPKGMATRIASGKIMNAVSSRLPELAGGSADLDPSTYTALKDAGDFEAPRTVSEATQGLAGGGSSFAGRNFHFGVREHAMGAMANGMAAHGGIVPYVSTFLIFSDYMRPPIRLSALMRLKVIHVFTHDSLALGEDGPTHQPVEHLAALRAIPDLVVIRPCDANETAEAWRAALTIPGPVALVLTRQSVPTLDRSILAPAGLLQKGAYILRDAPGGRADIILIASGSEVHLILEAQEMLAAKNLRVRAVSMPSWELFDAQPGPYRDSVLPPSVDVRLAVEAGVPQGWHKYVGDGGGVIGMDRFGASAPGPIVLAKYGFTVEHVVSRALELAGRPGEKEGS